MVINSVAAKVGRVGWKKAMPTGGADVPSTLDGCVYSYDILVVPCDCCTTSSVPRKIPNVLRSNMHQPGVENIVHTLKRLPTRKPPSGCSEIPLPTTYSVLLIHPLRPVPCVLVHADDQLSLGFIADASQPARHHDIEQMYRQRTRQYKVELKKLEAIAAKERERLLAEERAHARRLAALGEVAGGTDDQVSETNNMVD